MMVPINIGLKTGDNRTSNRIDGGTASSYPLNNTKHSPFDDVPGFRKNSLKRSSKKKVDKDCDLVNKMTSPTKPVDVDSYTTNHNEGVSAISISSSSTTTNTSSTAAAVSASSTIGRVNWIRFEENTEINCSNNRAIGKPVTIQIQQSEEQHFEDNTSTTSSPSAARCEQNSKARSVDLGDETSGFGSSQNNNGFENGVLAATNYDIYEEHDGGLTSPTVRQNWVLFEPPPSYAIATQSLVTKVDIQINDEPQGDNFLEDMTSEALLTDNKESKELRKSLENLLTVVNKTVTTIKDNISKTSSQENIEERFLVACDDDAKSEISDEVISLDYESEEENKKLRNTPIKKFTDVSLFQASSTIKNEKPNLSLTTNISIIKQDDAEETSQELYELVEPLDDYPPEILNNSWEFWYRYPDRRKKVRSRSWVKVKVIVEGEFIKLTGTIKNGADILKEIPLHPFFVFTIPTVHKGDKDGAVQSVKLQYVKYVETRRLQKGKWVIEHLPSYTPVLKIASRNILELKEFIISVEQVIRNIPTYRDKGITYRHEEIFVDCDDECRYILSGDGHVLRFNITVHMRLRVFVTGNPVLTLFLNDIRNKEIISKTKKNSLRETKPSTNWIKPRNFEYHPCVDVEETHCGEGVIFSPPDGCSFELLRFRVNQKTILPITCKSSLALLSNKSIRINASVQVTGDAKTIRYKRNDVKVYFPVPPSWGDLFVKSRTMKGLKQYVKAKGSKKASSIISKSTNFVTMQLNAGEATYDPSFGAIVWRLGCLPFIHGGLAADATHSFQCHLELTPECDSRDKFQRFGYVEFNIAQSFASGVSIEEILLSDEKEPELWSWYRSNYMYKINMKVKEDGKDNKDIS